MQLPLTVTFKRKLKWEIPTLIIHQYKADYEGSNTTVTMHQLAHSALHLSQPTGFCTGNSFGETVVWNIPLRVIMKHLYSLLYLLKQL